MSYTIEQRDALKAAIASGVTTVSHGGNTVTYRSVDEMIRVLGVMERELTPVSQRRGRLTYPQFQKGL